MKRAQVLSGHVLQAPVGVPQAPTSKNTAGVKPTKKDIASLIAIMVQYQQDFQALVEHGTPPTMTAWDYMLAGKHMSQVTGRNDLKGMVSAASMKGELATFELLPGPAQGARTLDDIVQVTRTMQLADAQGWNVQQIAKWQMQYGDRGLGSNIVVPKVISVGFGAEQRAFVAPQVIVADPGDAERIARVHVRKDGSFEPAFGDGVISTSDDEKWRQQREHLVEAFLPLSSLAKIFPVSLARAKLCAERLAEQANSRTPVDMSDFLLHEAQAQLQLALLGVPENVMEATNADMRATWQGNIDEIKPGALGKAMQTIIEATKGDASMALPTDACPVRGPLTRAIQTSDFSHSANFGNMLLVLFAGHDTTGHTMTWLMFELARHPAVQAKLQHEVDIFFEELGGKDPSYQDFSKLHFMDRCITETLRLWPAVANGTFRQLLFDDSVLGPSGKEVVLPKGTLINVVNWSRHRNPDLWDVDVDEFNPMRNFTGSEIARIGCPMAAKNPQSARFSPFAHGPRSCLGRNFAQMEMRLIMAYLLRRYDFKLAPPYDKAQGATMGATPAADEFRGVNRFTMGPMDLEKHNTTSWGERHLYALKMLVVPRCYD